MTQRIYKFRAWDAKYKYLTDDIAEYSPNHNYVKYRNGNEFKGIKLVTLWLDKDDNQLMQFTGLLDKNGKEIYEGDVVKLAGYKGNVFYWSGKKTTSSPGFYIAESGDEDDILTLGRDWEVIGNLYENPTLLESNL